MSFVQESVQPVEMSVAELYHIGLKAVGLVVRVPGDRDQDDIPAPVKSGPPGRSSQWTPESDFMHEVFAIPHQDTR